MWGKCTDIKQSPDICRKLLDLRAKQKTILITLCTNVHTSDSDLRLTKSTSRWVIHQLYFIITIDGYQSIDSVSIQIIPMLCCSIKFKNTQLIKESVLLIKNQSKVYCFISFHTKWQILYQTRGSLTSKHVINHTKKKSM